MTFVIESFNFMTSVRETFKYATFVIELSII